jgi:hypothetical protein
MRLLLLCALILTGCGTPRQPNSTEALAEQKQQVRDQLAKQNAEYNEKLRLAVRQVYVQDHPELSAEVRRAILKEKIRTGMTAWHVIAAYSLWDYTSDPASGRYREAGAPSLWTIADRRQTTTGAVFQEEWMLQRDKKTQHLYFENAVLKKLK